jgi:hypothetical protein
VVNMKIESELRRLSGSRDKSVVKKKFKIVSNLSFSLKSSLVSELHIYRLLALI